MANYYKLINNLKENKKEFIKRFGSDKYNQMYNYADVKYKTEPFEGTNAIPSAKLYQNITTNYNEFSKRLGKEKASEIYNYTKNKFDTETENAWKTYETVSTGLPKSALDQYGLKYDYTNSYEDQVRKAAGVVPASFDISQYTKDMYKPDGEEWTLDTPEQQAELLRQWSMQNSLRQTAAPLQDTMYSKIVQGAIDNGKAPDNVSMYQNFADTTKIKKAQNQNEQNKNLTDVYNRNAKLADMYNRGIDKEEQRLANIDLNVTQNEINSIAKRLDQHGKNIDVLNAKIGASYKDDDGTIKQQLAEEQKLYDALNQELAIKRNDYKQAEQSQLLTKYLNEPDFEEYAQKGAAIENDVQMVGQHAIGKINNKAKHYREIYQDEYANPESGLPEEYTLYHHMTEDEYNTYNYLLAKYGEGEADKYVGTIKESLNQRIGQTMADFYKGMPVMQLREAVTAGLDQFGSGVGQLFSEEALPTSKTQYAAQYMKEDMGDAGDVIFDVLQSIGNMAPAIGTSVLTGGLGAPAALSQGLSAGLFAASAGGNYYKQFIDEGHTPEQARGYALLAGASEGGLQYLLGGISSLGGKATSGVITKLTSKINNAIGRIALTLGGKALSEGTEEYLQDILNPIFRNIAANENNEFTAFSEDALYSFMLGALTAGLIESGGTIANNVSLNKAGVAVKESGNYDALINNALSLNPESKAYQMAESLKGKKPSNAAVGELIKEYVNETGNAEFMKQQGIVENTPDKNTQQTERKQTDYKDDTHRTAVSIANEYSGTELGDSMIEGVEKGEYDYEKKSPVPLLEKAINKIQSGELTKENYQSVTEDNGEVKSYNVNDMVNLIALLDDAVKRGDAQTQEELTATLIDAGYQSGRTVQAASLIKKASPQVHLAVIIKEIERFNAQGLKKYGAKWQNVSLTQDETNAILNETNYNKRLKLYQKAVERINKALPSTLWEKIDQLRKTGMLFNPKTQMRNILGNVAYAGMRSASRQIEAALQKLIPKEKRTTVNKINSKYKDTVKGDFETVRDAYSHYGRFNIESKLGTGYVQAFKDQGVGKLINKLSALTGQALEVGDVIFGKHHYETALAGFLQSRGLNEITGEARAYALKRALEATFRADSKAADAINALIKKGGVVGKATSIIMPFVKTPINIAKEGASYSALGLGKSLLVDTYRLKKGSIDITTYIHNLSKGLTGTAVSVLGFLLAKGLLIPGVGLTGAPPDDKREYELLKSQGWKPYSIQIGNVYIPITWAQPAGTTLLFGAALAEQTKTGEELELADIGDLTGILLDSLTDISPLSGVQDIFQYSEGIGDVGVNVVTDLASQFVPAIGKQIRQVVDPNVYNLYESDPLETVKNVALNGTGIDAIINALGGDADIAQKIDVWGNEVKQPDNIFARFGLDMVSPTNIGIGTQNNVDDELLRLEESTGKNVLPSLFKDKKLSTADIKEITGGEINLTDKQLQSLQEGIGQSAYTAIQKYMDSSNYVSDSDETKAKEITGIYDDVKTLYKNSFAYGVDIDSILPKVESQVTDYLSGESPVMIPEAEMFLDDWSYGVKSSVADDLFDMYKETGNNKYLLENVQDVDAIFEGIDNIDGLDYVMNNSFYDAATDNEKQKIVAGTIDDIINAMKPESLTGKPEVSTKNYDIYSTIGWREYGANDKVIKRLDSLGVYPKNTGTIDGDFASKDILGGSYTLTDDDKKLLAKMTHSALLRAGGFDKATAQKIIDDTYNEFKYMIIEREQ